MYQALRWLNAAGLASLALAGCATLHFAWSLMQLHEIDAAATAALISCGVATTVIGAQSPQQRHSAPRHPTGLRLALTVAGTLGTIAQLVLRSPPLLLCCCAAVALLGVLSSCAASAVRFWASNMQTPIAAFARQHNLTAEAEQAIFDNIEGSGVLGIGTGVVGLLFVVCMSHIANKVSQTVVQKQDATVLDHNATLADIRRRAGEAHAARQRNDSSRYTTMQSIRRQEKAFLLLSLSLATFPCYFPFYFPFRLSLSGTRPCSQCGGRRKTPSARI
eukprot:SAG31_NODE_155_length_22130_cov_9.540098_27_plen_276_part_00